MIYIITLIFVLACALFFDFGRVNNSRLKKICYTLILVWLIALSGFSYNVGSDIPGYMYQYAAIGRHHFESWKDLSYFENRQPGWMLLNIVCSRIYNRFVLLQLVIAIFSNYVILSFIKKHTKYLFIGIFLYCICSYLNFNFNVLRQTVALAFFLIGYDSLVEKKWVKYYLCCICAFMFHSTAIICFIFPFLYLIKVNKKWLIGYVTSILLLAILAVRNGGADFISDLFFQNAETLSLFADNAEKLTEIYFGNDAQEYGELNLFGIIAMLIYVSPVMLTLYGGIRRTIVLPHIGMSLMLFYALLFFLDFVVPVIFMRFLMYFDIIYFCAFADLVIELPKKLYLPRNVVAMVLLCLALFRPVTTLIAVNPSSNLPFYKQFVPYYSVFDPQIDPVRSANFGSYREE